MGELVEAHLADNEDELSSDERKILEVFAKERLHADEVASRLNGWIGINDHIR